MRRFYFHTEDHTVMHDHEGAEFETDDEARIEAVRRFAAIIASRPQDVWDGTRWRMTIAEDGGRILWSLEMHAEKGASVVPWARRVS